MAYAITQTCCNDASCVSVCPVNCIHPTPDEPDFGTTEILHIDPQTCIDCGACADACPVDAIFPVDRLLGPDTVYADLNEQYYAARPTDDTWDEPHFPRSFPSDHPAPRIAVVGTGPAACYTAQSLLRSGAEVTLIDRLPVPGGLVRFGVAPDHPSTKKIGDGFAGLYRHPRLRLHLNVEVGGDVTHAELAAHHHAVVYAVGAATGKALGIPGEALAGSISAMEFVTWYNSHPDVPATAVDLAGAERAVVVGNGNVAIDLARILVSDPEQLARTDIADHALEALRASSVREVVLLGRRGPEHAAYTGPELRALKHLPGVRLVVEDHPEVRDAIAGPDPTAALLRDLDLETVDWAAPPPAGRRIVLRFLSSPVELVGDRSVESVRVRRNTVRDVAGSSQVEGAGEDVSIPAQLVLRAIGYRGTPVADLPFDDTTATVPNDRGRVIDTRSGEHLAGTYVVGWIKRGPSGGIGTNRTCAAETVDALLDDAASRRLPAAGGTARAFGRLVRRRKPDAFGLRGMLAVDQAERERGRQSGRPRVKFATVPELLAAARRFRGR